MNFAYKRDDGVELDLVFPVLKVRHMLKTKIRACADRSVERDVFDIRFLVERYEGEVRGIAGEVDEGDLEVSLERVEVGVRGRMQEVLKEGGV